MAMNDFFDPEDFSPNTNLKTGREESKRMNDNNEFEFALQPTTTANSSTHQPTNHRGAGTFNQSYGGL